jgi:hypothetical protein
MIVGLSGKSGVGKNYVADRLFKPERFTVFSLAWALKNVCTARTGEMDNYERFHHTKPAWARELLQREGTENGWKLYGRFYWCVMAESWMRTLQENGIAGPDFVVPDVRFPHEVEWIHARGGKVVRIEPGLGIAIQQEFSDAAKLHESETALDKFAGVPGVFDATVVNSMDASNLVNMRLALQKAGVLHG